MIMRMERLAPAVMLVIFDDIPDRMEIEEPRQGIQFGVRAARNARARRLVVGRRARSRRPGGGARPTAGAGAVPRGLGGRAST